MALTRSDLWTSVSIDEIFMLKLVLPSLNMID